MAIHPDYRDLLSELNAADVEYLVVGAHALAYHAEPRFTKDLDIWVQASAENAPRVYSALAGFGAPLQEVEIDDFARPGLVYQVGIEPVRVDILTSVSGVEFESAYARRVMASYGDVPVPFISLRDLIANKDAAARPQDLVDVERLRELLGDDADRE